MYIKREKASLSMVKKIFTYVFLFAMSIAVYMTCSPSVWSKNSAIKKCKQTYEEQHGNLNAIANFVDRFEFRDSSFLISIRGSDGELSLDMLDSSGVVIGVVQRENVLPDKIYHICRDLNIAEIRSISTENYFRLKTGEFSNSNFDVDICILKKGKKEFNIANEDQLKKNLNEYGNFNYILGPFENVLFYSKPSGSELYL